MPLRISIDPDRCMGSGSCSFHAPATFDVGEDDVAVVLDPAGDPPDAVRRAADGCPTQAITVGDDDGAGAGDEAGALDGVRGEAGR